MGEIRPQLLLYGPAQFWPSVSDNFGRTPSLSTEMTDLLTSPAFAGLHVPISVSGPAPSSVGGLLNSSSRRRRPRTERHPRMCAAPPTNTALASTPAHEIVDKADTADPEKQYVPLHVHSDFSLLDGASQVSSLAARAAELGVPALALTDHGVLYGAVALVRACSAAGVKPVIGNEMYVVNGEPGAPPPQGSKAPRRYHLVVLAKNTTGYRNLVKLTTMAHLHGKVGKGIFARPSINKAMLYEHREGLIVSSGCLGGEVAQAIMKKRPGIARDVARWFRDAFGDDYYLEIQDHGSAEDRLVNRELIKIGTELGIKVVATNDSHFTSCLDAEAHDALICIQTGKVLSDKNRMRYAGNEFFKSVEEMRNCFIDHLHPDDIDGALRNTLEVAEKVEEYNLFGATRIPHYPVPSEFENDTARYLRHIAREEMAERLAVRQAYGLSSKDSDEEYNQRLNFELKMIDQMGFSSYFLVVWDYIRFAREQRIPVGPGRGSAAGSLVAFALRITDVDPIAYHLLFERFLNPERKSMPDIDTDFSVEGRERVIAYVSERYGQDRVAQIITFNRLTSKAVLKDIARVHEVPYSEADKLAKLIPVFRGKPVTLTKMMSDDTPSPEFKKKIESDEVHSQWIGKAQRIEGANKTFGIHAAGVVISASPLDESVPLSIAKHGETITQYPMEDVESLGLLKMDFLGLKNLSVIESALSFINAGRRRKGVYKDFDFSVDALPLDDKKTFELLATGELDGIFQLDASLGMRNIVRELRPSSLEDISAVLALYRPGPLDAGLIPKFIRRKHGTERIDYDHPLLKPILSDTYGIMVYQEQIMRIARDLAGYSLGQADILRRAMGKKKVKDMEQERPRFIAGCVERGVTEEVAKKLFEMMIQFAEYCFNKSHSTAYAYLTYQTAYLKANYPVEYAAALLSSNMTNPDKLVRYLSDANVSGVKVKPPSINQSEIGFTVQHKADGEPVVMFGLEAVKTVGSSVSEAVIEERTKNGPYKSIIDLIERVNSRVLNKRSMSALVLCGAFDDLHPNRKVLSEQLEELLTLRRKLRDRRKRREKKELSEEEEQAELAKDALQWEEVEMALEHEGQSHSDFTLLEKLKAEKSTLGFYASGHPLFDLKDYRRFLGTTPVSHIVGESDASVDGSGVVLDHEPKVRHGDEVSILSLVSELTMVKTARGLNMAKWMVEDDQSRMQGVVFPSAYAVVEQERNSQVDAASQYDLENFDDDGETEPERVVQQDARVVVWGRVDRESTGNTQLFIDDVQRVEDVSVVMATAEYNPYRNSFEYKSILREKVGEFLGVSGKEKSMTYTYSDKSGNKVTRTRRPAKVDFKTKKRNPLVLCIIGKDGYVADLVNMGNQYRLGDVTDDELAMLSRRTNLHFEMVNALDGLERTKKIIKIAEKATPKENSVNIIETRDANVQYEPSFMKEDAFAVPEVANSDAKDSFFKDSVSVPEVVAAETFTVSEVVSSTVERPNENEICAVAGAEEKQLINSKEAINSKVEEKEGFATVLKKWGKKRSDFAELTDDEFEAMVRSSVKQREEFQSPSFRPTERSIISEEFNIISPVTMAKSPKMVVQEKKKPRVLASMGSTPTTSFLDDDISTDSFLSNSFSEPPSRKHRHQPVTEPSSSYPPTREYMEYLIQKIDRIEQKYDMVVDQLRTQLKIPVSDETIDNINESLRVSSSIVEKVVVRRPEDSNSTVLGEPMNSTIEDKSQDVAKSPQQIGDETASLVPKPTYVEPIVNGGKRKKTNTIAKTTTDYAKIWKTSSDRVVSPSTARRNEVRVGASETARLLDTICYVASDAAFKHCQVSFQMLVTSGFDLSSFESSDQLVNLSARVVAVELNCIAVSVTVVESIPTKNRHARKTLLSGTVVYRASSPIPRLKYKTKVAQSALKVAMERLENRLDALQESEKLGVSMWDIGKKGMKRKDKNWMRNENATPSVHSSDTLRVTTTRRAELESEVLGFSDGGQLLVWLMGAAENCAAGNIPDVEDSCTMSLELLHVPHATQLESDWDTITVRSKLSFVNGVMVTVNVAAQLFSRGEAQGDPIQAVFRVECTPYKAVSAIRICEQNWAPFDSKALGEVVPLLKSLCMAMKQSVH